MQNQEMTTFILALIGALAWVYPLIVWIKKQVTKTELEIINHTQLQIGYTSFGPIINIDLAFSASKEDAFIKNLSIDLSHDSNQISLYKWNWFEEKFLEIDTPETGPIPYKKNQKAIALKILTSSLVEKTVGFQIPAFLKQHSVHYEKIFEVYQNLKSNNTPTSELKKDKEYIHLQHFFKDSFTWKVGKYQGTIKAEVANRDKVFTKDFEFILTSVDIRNLEKNIELCLVTLEENFVNEAYYIAKWNWITTTDIKNS